MLDWLTRLFKPQPPDERGLFRYYNGVRWRVVCPITAWNCLFRSQTFSFEKHIPMLQIAEERLEAAQATAEAVREAFDIPDLNDGGLSTLQCVTLLNDFLAWMEVQKKNSNPTPISPTPTIAPSLEPSPPPNAWDSGLTAIERSNASAPDSSTPCASC